MILEREGFTMISVKRALCIILTACLLLFFIPQPRANAQPASNEIKTGICYTFLENNYQREYYLQLADALVNCRAYCPAYDSDHLTGEEANFVAHLVVADYPECFWAYAGDNSTPVSMTYNADGKLVPAYSSELFAAQEIFNLKVQDIINGIPERLTSDIDKAAYLLEYVSNNVNYGYSGGLDSAYDALVNGTVTCGGFARAYACLLKKAGINCIAVTGMKGEGHAWNALWIDGLCYFVEPQGYHGYLFSMDDMISRGYAIDEVWSELLSNQCGQTTALTYKNQIMHSKTVVADANTTISEIANCFSPSIASDVIWVYDCYIEYTSGDFSEWWKQIYKDVGAELGLGLDCIYTARQDINRYHVSLQAKEPPSSAPSVQKVELIHDALLFTSLCQNEQLMPRLVPDVTTIPISYHSSNPNVAVVDQQGFITPISNGTTVITVSAGGVSKACSVTVSLKNCSHNLRFVRQGEPNCYNNGNKAYYCCDTCGVWFYDKNATQAIDNRIDISIPSKGHTFNSEWEAWDEWHFRQCSAPYCYAVEDGTHYDSNSDGACDVCNYGAQSNTTPSVTQPNQTAPSQKPTAPPTTPPTQQTSPSDTTDPSETTTPSSPTNPTDSTVPSVPTSQPTIPSDPTESTSSSDPLTPSVGSTPETSATPSGTTAAGNPEPGNDDHPNSTWIIYVALLLGIGGIISYLIYKRKVKSS